MQPFILFLTACRSLNHPYRQKQRSVKQKLKGDCKGKASFCSVIWILFFLGCGNILEINFFPKAAAKGSFKKSAVIKDRH